MESAKLGANEKNQSLVLAVKRQSHLKMEMVDGRIWEKQSLAVEYSIEGTSGHIGLHGTIFLRLYR